MKNTDNPIDGIYRVQLDLLVRAKDSKEAAKMVQGRRGAVKLLRWKETTIRDPSGRVNPAWRVTQRGKQISVEMKRKSKVLTSSR